MNDFLVLGGEPGQGLGAEVRELVDRLLRLGRPSPELGVLCLEPGDLSLAGVGDLAGVLQRLDRCPGRRATAGGSRSAPA
ncbi:hypothetical protein [Streptomyces sp. NPDC059928]|uniref:hypothetical protein n=1 Tax=unclassified Streptomyces TaxID=2593676 RepID=UPI00365C8952